MFNAAGGQTDCWEFTQSLPQLIYYQVLLRGLPTASVVGSFVPLIARPYLNEVIFLQRNPWRAEGKNSISTGQRRPRCCIAGRGGEFFVRSMLNLVIGSVLIAAFWDSSPWCGAGGPDQQDGPPRLHLSSGRAVDGGRLFHRRALWGYLDLRIRREGWEVRKLAYAGRTGPLDENAASELNRH